MTVAESKRRTWRDFARDAAGGVAGAEASERWSGIRLRGLWYREQEVAERLRRDPPPPVIPEIANLPDGVLTVKQREALVLWTSYALSFREVADQLGISRNAARKRIEAGRRRIDAYWGTWDPEDFEEDE